MVDHFVPKSPCGPEELDYWFNFTTNTANQYFEVSKVHSHFLGAAFIGTGSFNDPMLVQ